METRPPTFGRILVAVGFAVSCFGLLLFTWLAFGGAVPLKPESYRITVPFQEATQLAVESDVRISGVSVGKVKAIELSDEGSYADAEIQIAGTDSSGEVEAVILSLPDGLHIGVGSDHTGLQAAVDKNLTAAQATFCNSITVRAHISDGLRATGHGVETRDGVLHVRGSCPVIGSEWCNVDYTIEMPADLYVSATGRGGVSATDLDGGLDARSRSSRVNLLRVGGDLTVETDEGSIVGDDLRTERVDASTDQGSLRLTFVTSPNSVLTEADQGSIDVVLPDEPGVYYAVDAQSDQGSVTSAVREKSDSDRSLTAEADQGSITIGYADP